MLVGSWLGGSDPRAGMSDDEKPVGNSPTDEIKAYFRTVPWFNQPHQWIRHALSSCSRTFQNHIHLERAWLRSLGKRILVSISMKCSKIGAKWNWYLDCKIKIPNQSKSWMVYFDNKLTSIARPGNQGVCHGRCCATDEATHTTGAHGIHGWILPPFVSIFLLCDCQEWMSGLKKIWCLMLKLYTVLIFKFQQKLLVLMS